MAETAVSIDMREDGGAVFRFTGRVVVTGLAALERKLAGRPKANAVVVDLTDVEALDTAGAWLITSLKDRLEAEGARVEITGAAPAQQTLIDAVVGSRPKEEGTPPPARGFIPWVAGVGKFTVETGMLFVELLNFFGLVLARFFNTVIHPRHLRLTSLVYHCQEVGLNAVPIISLMAFLIGVVLAFQGSVQLRQFGAEVFVVNLIAISVLRELGVLLTAIIVAGRSGSAFTASIGSMKIREEIDAMETLGLDPVEVLVLPRVLALVIMLPILGFIADLMGLFGGALMSWIDLGVSPGMFITRLYDTTDVWHFGVGMIKAPFFATIVGVIGCYCGLKVEGSAESVGRMTTASVVMSIFGVIVCDAVFSIFFAEVGV